MARRHIAKGSGLSEHTKELILLSIGDVVQVQNQTGKNAKKWDKSGSVVEVLPFKQYRVKIDGSGQVTLRARQILRRITPYVLGRNPRVGSELMRNQGAGSQEHTLEVSCNDERKSEESMTVTEVPVLRRSERVAAHHYEVTPTQEGS